MLEQRMNIVTIGVADLLKMTKFYEELFGWEKSDQSNENVSFFKLNGIFLSLYPREKLAEDSWVSSKGEGWSGFTMAYCTRSKDEVDQFVDKLQQQGVKVTKAPEAAFWGGYSSCIADPEGNIWEIAHNPFLEMDAEDNAI